MGSRRSIALVKTGPMSDVVHGLPVVSDILRAMPGARVDFIVEEAWSEVARLHPGIGQVVPVAVRRWRAHPWTARTRGEIAATRKRLRGASYELVIDIQGRRESAWVARLAAAPIAGFSIRSASEPLASLAYRRRFDVQDDLHPIERVRSLAAQALGYAIEGPPAFDLEPPAWTPTGFPEGACALLLHGASDASRQWPAEHWSALIPSLAAMGVRSVLPWDSQRERESAQRICADASRSGETVALAPVVLPHLSLDACAAAIDASEVVIGVDTGLTHLSAALGAPTVALFGATSASRRGPYWSASACSLGGDGSWPQVDEVVAAAEQVVTAAVREAWQRRGRQRPEAAQTITH